MFICLFSLFSTISLAFAGYPNVDSGPDSLIGYLVQFGKSPSTFIPVSNPQYQGNQANAYQAISQYYNPRSPSYDASDYKLPPPAYPDPYKVTGAVSSYKPDMGTKAPYYSVTPAPYPSPTQAPSYVYYPTKAPAYGSDKGDAYYKPPESPYMSYNPPAPAYDKPSYPATTMTPYYNPTVYLDVYKAPPVYNPPPAPYASVSPAPYVSPTTASYTAPSPYGDAYYKAPEAPSSEYASYGSDKPSYSYETSTSAPYYKPKDEDKTYTKASQAYPEKQTSPPYYQPPSPYYSNYKTSAPYGLVSYTPAPYTPASYTPAPYTPAPYNTPAPYTPAPYAPAPYTPAPYTPAPYTPAPYNTPAPYTPAPYAPAPYTPAPYQPYKPASPSYENEGYSAYAPPAPPPAPPAYVGAGAVYGDENVPEPAPLSYSPPADMYVPADGYEKSTTSPYVSQESPYHKRTFKQRSAGPAASNNPVFEVYRILTYKKHLPKY